MRRLEIVHLFVGLLVVFLVSSSYFLFNQEYIKIPEIAVFAFLVIIVSVYSKKFMAYLLDSNVEHRILFASRFGFKPNSKLKRDVPIGVLLPILISILSLGVVRFLSILSYESSSVRARASKRFGFYSFTEITEWHNALIGSAGIVGLMLLSIVAYFVGYEDLSKLSVYYFISNLFPIAKSDGMQIFFGSRALYITLLAISLVFFVYALII
jgi:hypothetical protein